MLPRPVFLPGFHPSLRPGFPRQASDFPVRPSPAHRQALRPAAARRSRKRPRPSARAASRRPRRQRFLPRFPSSRRAARSQCRHGRSRRRRLYQKTPDRPSSAYNRPRRGKAQRLSAVLSSRRSPRHTEHPPAPRPRSAGRTRRTSRTTRCRDSRTMRRSACSRACRLRHRPHSCARSACSQSGSLPPAQRSRLPFRRSARGLSPPTRRRFPDLRICPNSRSGCAYAPASCRQTRAYSTLPYAGAAQKSPAALPRRRSASLHSRSSPRYAYALRSPLAACRRDYLLRRSNRPCARAGYLRILPDRRSEPLHNRSTSPYGYAPPAAPRQILCRRAAPSRSNRPRAGAPPCRSKSAAPL